VLLETANILPAFNNSNDYSANATLALSIPVFKRLSASISTTDNYLNDPQVGYKKNSYQFVTGVTYLLR
jgi:heme-binding NEAT domain protein